MEIQTNFLGEKTETTLWQSLCSQVWSQSNIDTVDVDLDVDGCAGVVDGCAGLVDGCAGLDDGCAGLGESVCVEDEGPKPSYNKDGAVSDEESIHELFLIIIMFDREWAFVV